MDHRTEAESFLSEAVRTADRAAVELTGERDREVVRLLAEGRERIDRARLLLARRPVKA